MAKNNVNPIIIEPNDNIGALSAERDDQFLFTCFFDHPAHKDILTSDAARSILYGRTGTGKTAIIRYLEKHQSCTRSIDLSEVSLDYLVNSDAIQLLHDLEMDANVIFQAFWRYIICVAYIQLKYKLDNQGQSQRWTDGLLRRITRESGERRAAKFLAEHRGKFWVDTDVILEEYAKNIDEEVHAELGASIEIWKSDAGWAKKQSQAKKIQIQRRLKNVIKPQLVSELSDLIRLLKEDLKSDGRTFYVLIDGIDENWIEEKIRYKLIRSLVETQKTFRSLTDMKLVISMRADIFDRALSEAKDPSIQRDKLQDYKTGVNWSKPQLFELVETRVKELSRFKYTKQNVSFEDIFPRLINDKKPFDYLLERTLHRPRDIILFVNLCLESAAGKSEVSAGDIKTAEGEFSRTFKRGLTDEWKSCLPSVEILLSNLASLRKTSDSFETFIARYDFSSLYLTLLDFSEGSKHDPIYKIVSQKSFDIENKNSISDLAKAILSELYRIGALGIKPHPDGQHVYVFKGPTYIDPTEITEECSWYIHRGLRSALGMTDRRNLKP